MHTERDLLAERAATTPDRVAVTSVDSDDSLSYGALDDWVDRLAGTLAGTDGRRVGVLLEPGPAVPVATFAIWRTGRSAVLLDPQEPVDALDRLCDRAAVSTLVCEPQTAEVVQATDVERVLSVDADGGTPERQQAVRAEEAVVAFTSGSAGEPKGVRLPMTSLLASATASAMRLGVSADDRWLCCLPTHHMGGFAPFVRSTLAGTTVVTQRAFDAEATASVLGEISIVSLVPTMLGRLLDAGWVPEESLRVVLLGGAPASPELLERAIDAGVPVHTTYGMTETASQVATAVPEQVASDPASVGHPLLGTRVAIVDEDGEALPPGQRGEVRVAGPTVMAGYLDDERTATAFDDGWLITGDVGFRSADGSLTITGRVGDRILTGGETVDATEVAAVLESMAEIDGAAVVDLPDPDWGERVGALLSTDEPVAAILEATAAVVSEELAPHKRPKTVATIETLPRTASGTVDREAARRRLEEHGVDLDNGQ